MPAPLDCSFEDYLNKPREEQRRHLERDNLPFHVLTADQFDRDQIEAIADLATSLRSFVKKHPQGREEIHRLLIGRRVMMYFVQPSSRTFLSFEAAAQMVGAGTSDVRDTATSSEVKGETLEDSIRTFSSYFDAIVIRYPKANFADRCALMLNSTNRAVPVLSGGSGPDEHPTQGLLDIYTLQGHWDRYGGIDGRNICMLGDLKRGRTVRSLCRLLSLYEDMSLSFVSPEGFEMGSDIKKLLDERNVKWSEYRHIDEVIESADAFYLTRVQDEWGASFDDSVKDSVRMTPERLSKAKASAAIMHPLPRRDELPACPEIDIKDHRCLHWRQERNGMWIRAALLLVVMGVAIPRRERGRLVGFDWR